MNEIVDHLKQWVGKKENRTDTVAAWPVAALNATLDRRDPEPRDGDPVPPGWHWLYFLETVPASELGDDGHPRRGGFLPPVTLPHRMWAGGRIEFRRALRVGDAIRRDSEVLSVEPKRGKSGSLVFVTVRHTVTAAGEIAVVEQHDIVYREAAKSSLSPLSQKGDGGNAPAQGSPAPRHAAWRRELVAGPVMLFRFSALIFNAHRIHYDLDYCQNEEHYPGLIVHGPLQTILLLDLCRRKETRPVRRLDYRAVHPVFHTERLTVNGNPRADGATADLWTANAAGTCAMVGTAYFT